MQTPSYFKVYRIRIKDNPDFRFWYWNKDGKEYNAILKAKYTSDAMQVVFYVIDQNHLGEWQIPIAMMTIRPEDCFVVNETLERFNHALHEFARRTVLEKDEKSKYRILRQAS